MNWVSIDYIYKLEKLVSIVRGEPSNFWTYNEQDFPKNSHTVVTMYQSLYMLIF